MPTAECRSQKVLYNDFYPDGAPGPDVPLWSSSATLAQKQVNLAETL